VATVPGPIGPEAIGQAAAALEAIGAVAVEVEAIGAVEVEAVGAAAVESAFRDRSDLALEHAPTPSAR
jgi:hypothetical protein